MMISIHALREEGDIGVARVGIELGEISIHALREEGDPPEASPEADRVISIHALREEGDYSCDGDGPQERISIHALREEGDFWWADVPRICIEFLSTPSARRATHRRPAPGSRGSDFYPRPPRGGRPPARSDPRSGSRISIHALREEGDRCGGGKGKSPADFYPRPPRGGRRGSK